MITSDNVKEVLNMLNLDEIREVLDADGDYIRLSLSVLNIGYVVHIDSESEYLEDDIHNDWWMDKDQFLLELEEHYADYENI